MERLFAALADFLAQGPVGPAPTGHIYPASRARRGDTALALARWQGRKWLCEMTPKAAALSKDFAGDIRPLGEGAVKFCPLTHANALALRQHLPWTAPVSLRERRTTIGCGDRLGRATPGHLRAARGLDVSPVLAQQSIRELNLTGRTYENVVDDVTFLVFQEGYRTGYGADGDHLKTLDNINMAIDAGMAMITLDLSDVMLAAAQKWTAAEVENGFSALPADQQAQVLATYADKTFDVGGTALTLNALEARRCAVMYLKAMDFAREVYLLLRKRRGDAFDLEISIDETQAPTLPAHHLFIIRELLRRDVVVSSLAPRFIGEFQKAIDYVGDLEEFERQFAVHCAIARAHGDYKVSIHSGSDKFGAFPIIGRHTGLRVHVKTAGTSWLEAVRTVAECDPALYRQIHTKALSTFPEALKFYHVTPDLARVPEAEAVADRDLPGLMSRDDARQVLHVTYGFILKDEDLGPRFLASLDLNEEVYYGHLQGHFRRHLESLGVGSQALQA